jgi:hypothetical protein
MNARVVRGFVLLAAVAGVVAVGGNTSATQQAALVADQGAPFTAGFSTSPDSADPSVCGSRAANQSGSRTRTRSL